MLTLKKIMINRSTENECYIITDKRKTFYVNLRKEKVKVIILYAILFWNDNLTAPNLSVWDFINKDEI